MKLHDYGVWTQITTWDESYINEKKSYYQGLLEVKSLSDDPYTSIQYYYDGKKIAYVIGPDIIRICNTKTPLISYQLFTKVFHDFAKSANINHI